MQILRVLLVGCGYHARHHYLEELCKAREVSLVGVCDLPDFESALSKLLPGIQFFSSLSKALNDTKPDLVVVSTPHNLHYKQAKQCLTQGVPVLVDKPLAMTEAQGMELLEISQARKIYLGSAVPLRYGQVNALIGRLIAENRLGELSNIDISYYRATRLNFVESWRNDSANGGVIMDAGFPLLDLVLRYVPNPLTDVICFASKSVYNVDISAKILARMPNGGVANINVGLHEIQGAFSQRIFVSGSDGVFEYVSEGSRDSSSAEARIYTKCGYERILLSPENDDAQPLRATLDLVRNGELNTKAVISDLQTLRLIEKVYHVAVYG